MRSGDVLRLETPGGGGDKDPLEHPPELVLQDVQRGYYDRETTEREYGVLIKEDNKEVDAEGTAQLRASLRTKEGI